MSEEKNILLPNPSKLVVSSSPHLHKGNDVQKIMIHVIIALIPACLVGIYVFGWSAAQVLIITIISCVLIEAISLKLIGKSQNALKDGTAVLTGMLLAMNLSASTPWWVCVIGALLAIVLAKQLFGGLGYNPFNPALVARVGLLIGFPTFLTSWAPTKSMLSSTHIDAVTCATPLYQIPLTLKNGTTEILSYTNMDLFLGNIPGSLGETSALALLIGGLYLIVMKIVCWRIPAFFIGGVAVIAGIHHMIEPKTTLTITQHLFSGGLFIGAFFMATDMVTSPETKKGAIIFALGCAIVTYSIRVWGAYPEGVSFAILFMNACCFSYIFLKLSS